MELREQEALADADVQAMVFAADLPWGLENYHRLYPPEEKSLHEHTEVEQETPGSEADIQRMLNEARRAGAIK